MAKGFAGGIFNFGDEGYWKNAFNKKGYAIGSGKKDSGGGQFPDAPEYWSDPNVAWSQDNLKSQYSYLMNGLTTEGGSLGGLMGDTVSFNPQITQLALEQMQAQLAPSYRQGGQDIVNQLEANNQLTGSTTASSLGNYQADYMSQLTAATANAGIQDINRALQNRVSLYGTGLNTAQVVGANALNNQSQRNNFALGNYDNQVAQILGNEPPQTGGTSGAIQGAIGGGMAGFSMGGLYGGIAGAALGAYSGYSSQGNAGGGLLQAGGYALGSKYSSPGTYYGGRESIYNPSTSYTSGSSGGNIYGYQPLNSNSVGLGRGY